MPDIDVPTVTVHMSEAVGSYGEQIIVQWADGGRDVSLVIKTKGQERHIRLTELNAAKLGYGLAQAVGHMWEGRQHNG